MPVSQVLYSLEIQRRSVAYRGIGLYESHGIHRSHGFWHLSWICAFAMIWCDFSNVLHFCVETTTTTVVYGRLSRTTRVSQYQKKHSPTHHPDHHPIFISFFHLRRSIASSLFKLRAWIFLHNLSPRPFWSISWSGALHLIFHTFLQPISVFFLQHVPIPSQPVLLYQYYVI